MAALLLSGLVGAGCTSSPGGSAPTTAARTAATSLPTTQLTVNSSPDTSTTAPASTTTSGPPAPPDVPAPPDPAAVPSGSPADQAKALSDALAGGGDGTAATWLAVYTAAGVPVLDTPAAAAPDADQMGPHWWQVWDQLPNGDQGAGIRLDELLQFLPDTPSPDTLALGAAALADLRAAAAGTDADAFLAEFVATRARARTGLDPLDPAVTPDEVVLDGETAQLVAWSEVRGVVARESAAPGTFGTTPPTSSGLLRTRRAGFDCGSLFGSNDATYWVNWFANKMSAGSGVGIFGLGSLPTLWNALSGAAPGLISADGATRANKISARLNVLTSLLTLLMQLNAIKLSGFPDPSPLDRTNKASSDGNQSRDNFELDVDASDLPDGNIKALCGLSFLLNAAGIQFQFPANGKLPGVEVQITPMEGFGQQLGGGYVQLPDQSDLKQVTSAVGAFAVDVQGVHQKHDIPDTNPRLPREYSMGISAQPAEVNGNNIFNTFFDGLTTTDATGVAAGAIDVAQTIHWDLGEQVFPLDDWIAGYTIDQTTADAYHVTGRVCDFEQPFHLDTVGDLHNGVQNKGTFTVSKAGWQFTGVLSQGGHALPSDGQGSTIYVTTDPENPGIRIGAGSWTFTAPIVGKLPLGPNGTHIDGFQLELNPTQDCEANS